VAPGLSVEMLEDNDMWAQYPYMSRVPKSEIGDEEGADLTDNGVNLERLADAIEAAEKDEEEEVNEEADGNESESGSLPTDWDEGEWHKVPDEAQGSNKNLITWMKKVGLIKEPVTKLSFGENLLPLNEHASNLESEEFRRKRPIKGLCNDYYTLDEALDHLCIINEHLDNETRFSERLKLEEALNHFENELRIHEAIDSSSNVTLRAYQYGKQKFEKENHDCDIQWDRDVNEIPSGLTPKREVAGEWNDEWMNSRREIAMNWDEIQQLQLTRGVAITDEEINELLN
jgi:hypothetical protein